MVRGVPRRQPCPDSGQRRCAAVRDDRAQAGFSAAQLTYFLLDPHPKMPNMALTRTEAADLAAYIATLGK